MEYLNSTLDNFIISIQNISMPDILSNILSVHVFPILIDMIFLGYIWILASIYLKIKGECIKAPKYILIGLFICAIIGNEIMRPLLFHFRLSLEASGISIYLPNPGRYAFPGGQFMMSVSSVIILYFANKEYGKYAFIATGILLFINLHDVFAYKIDFLIALILGSCIGLLLGFLRNRKVKEEEEFEEFANKFHF